MKKRKKHSIGKFRRKYHHFFFLLGFAAGGVLGFNLRKIADTGIEALEKLKSRTKSKKNKKEESENTEC